MSANLSGLDFTKKELEQQRQGLALMHRRFDIPIVYATTADGWTATRDGNTGRGHTEQEAWIALYRVEQRQILDPARQFKEILDQLWGPTSEEGIYCDAPKVDIC